MRWTLVTVTAVTLAGSTRPVPPTEEVRVIGTDYAFLLPPVVRAGSTVFVLINRGQVPHEMALAQLRAGITATDSAPRRNRDC